MEKNKIKEHLKKIAEKLEMKDYKKCTELIKHVLKHSTYSLEILKLKLKCEEAMNKLEDALKTTNMILFI